MWKRTTTGQELEEIYGINLDPKRLINEPAVVEGRYGKGRVILSLLHFDTLDDVNGAKVLRNLWEYFGVDSGNAGIDACQSVIASKNRRGLSLFTDEARRSRRIGTVPDADELESAVDDVISLGIRNFLWFWRNPMLLQWRRGVRGLEYCTLYVMIKELSGFIRLRRSQLSAGDKEKLQSIKKLLIPFTEKAKQLLILERHEIQNGHITYERCDNPEIQKIKNRAFRKFKESRRIV